MDKPLPVAIGVLLSLPGQRRYWSMNEAPLEVELTAYPAQEDVRVLEEGLERFNRETPVGADRTKLPIAVWVRRQGACAGWGLRRHPLRLALPQLALGGRGAKRPRLGNAL